MRYFENLYQALSEIKRDLAKAPILWSERVQNKREDRPVREAQNYAYTIEAGGIPSDVDELLDIAAVHLEPYKDPEFRGEVKIWLLTQMEERLSSVPLQKESDFLHPILKDYAEGNSYSYTYQERMIGAVPLITSALDRDPGTRRVYWPIYWPQDMIRASKLTRIPCSLGYHFMIREVPRRGKVLHLTYLSRSVDFEHFLVTDLYLAYQFQRWVLENLRSCTQLGNLTHFIVSLHAFEPEEEVY